MQLNAGIQKASIPVEGEELMKKDDVLALSRESFRRAYGATMDSWRSLDTKAQGATAIAGFFLAATVGWSRIEKVGLEATEGWIFLAVIASLAFSVVCAVIALITRSVPSPPEGSFIDDLVFPLAKRMSQSDDLADDQATALHEAITGKWKEAIKLAGRMTRFKATWIRRSHLLLIVAASLAVSILSSHVVRPVNEGVTSDDVQIIRRQCGNETWRTVTFHSPGIIVNDSCESTGEHRSGSLESTTSAEKTPSDSVDRDKRPN